MKITLTKAALFAWSCVGRRSIAVRKMLLDYLSMMQWGLVCWGGTGTECEVSLFLCL